MAPKRRIVTKRNHKSRLVLSTKRVAKRKLKKGLLEKAKGRESAPKRSRSRRASSPRTRNQPENASRKRGTPESHSPAKTAGTVGRPSRFDETEEAFLRNVPKQLKEYAFRPGHAPTPGAGRPKNTPSLTSRLRGILCMPIEGREKEKGKPAVTYADELMSLALQAARRGDYRFFQHIYERIDGKVPDHVVIEEVQQMVAQESEKVTEEVVKVVGAVALEVFGEKRAAVFREKLTAAMPEKLGEKDAGLRAS